MPTILESLNTALHSALEVDQRVIVLGEDILDPYGGAFKVTRGLSSAYPDRVLTTPVSEAGIVGVAAGMALRGLRPVVEIMFGDFITLAADQLINHISKFRYIYNDQVHVPLVIRTPMGGRRGYGPTHSQSLEKIFMGVPGLSILAANQFDDPGKRLLQTILGAEGPTLFIENKLLYAFPILDSKALIDFEVLSSDNGLTCTLTIPGAPLSDLTIVAYGYMAELCRQAALRLAYEHEIFVELVIPTELSPLDVDPILISVNRTRHLLVVEEGTQTLGWGSEILASIVERSVDRLLMSRRLAAVDSPIPASAPLEAAMLPDIDRIISTAKIMV